jgi:hypothetical protein
MEPNEAQRADLAQRVAEVRLSRYGGKRRAAYNDVGVNPTTWQRLELGERVREDILVGVLLKLWPETRGDWQRMDPPLKATFDARPIEELIDELEAMGAHPVSLKKIRAEIEAQRAALESEGEVKDA